MLTRRSLVASVLACSLLAWPATAAADGDNDSAPRAMTRNVYAGADFSAVLSATSVAQLMTAAADARRAVEKTAFAARARGLAAEIDAHDPWLVGLQEVASYRDGTLAQPELEEGPVEDFLPELLEALRTRGLHYRVAAQQQEVDVANVPTGAPSDGSPAYHRDTRLTLRDVILVRSDLPAGRFSVSNPDGGNYAAALETAAGVRLTRGWASVDVRIAGTTARRFVTTHLEAIDDRIRLAQARELIASRALAPDKPVVLAGDLNSDPAAAPGGPSGRGAYDLFVSAGFGDTGNTEPTCCYAPDLLAGALTERIDHVLTRPGIPGGVRTTVVGDEPDNRVRSPFGELLWPSDHGGVVAGL